MLAWTTSWSKHLPTDNNDIYCHYMKRINLNKFLNDDDDDDAKTFRFKLSRNFLKAFNHSTRVKHLNATNQEEIIYNFNKNAHSDRVSFNLDETLIINEELISLRYYIDDLETKNIFANANKSLFIFRVINKNYIKIQLNYDENQRLKSLANRTIKFEFVSKVEKSSCSLLVEFYDEKTVPVCDQIEYNGKYLNATFISIEKFKSDLGIDDSDKIKLDLTTLLPDTLGNSQRYSIVCLKCSMDLELKLTQHLLQIKSSNHFFMEEENAFIDIDLLIQKELNNDYDDNFLSKNFYLNVRVYNSKRIFVSLYDDDKDEEKRSKRYLLQNGNDVLNGSGSGGGGVVSKTQLMQGGAYMLKSAQLAITEETIGLQTRLKIYEHAWVDYQLNASEYVKQRIQLIAPDNPILNITQPFDYETGGAEHTFQIIFTRKTDKRTSNLNLI